MFTKIDLFGLFSLRFTSLQLSVTEQARESENFGLPLHIDYNEIDTQVKIKDIFKHICIETN